MANGYDPDITLVEKRRKPYSSSKMMNPAITWAMIFAIVSGTATGVIYYTDLRASIADTNSLIKAAEQRSVSRHGTAMGAIQHEESLRLITSNNLGQDLDEVKEDVKDLKETVKDGDEKTQELLRQLIQNQSNG
jgi:hypothetical protein